MARFVTFDDLRRFARELDERSILKTASQTRQGKTVFLSHSSKDAPFLSAVVDLLEKHGARVYVDLRDDRLPKEPSSETGELLRDTIVACRKLILFVTTNSKESRWAPWELGVGEGHKKAANVCLVPAAEHAVNGG